MKLLSIYFSCLLVLQNLFIPSFALAMEKSTWFKVENKECEVFNLSPEKGESANWEGSCEDGKISGNGKLIWKQKNAPTSIILGNWVKGRLEGNTLTFYSSKDVETLAIEYGPFRKNIREGTFYQFDPVMRHINRADVRIDGIYHLTKYKYSNGSFYDLTSDLNLEYTYEQAMEMIQGKKTESSSIDSSTDIASLLVVAGIAAGGLYLIKSIFSGGQSNLSASSSSSSSGRSGSYTDCRIDGQYIMLNNKDIGRFDGKYIVNTDFKTIGQYDGNYIKRFSDGKDVCFQDGKYVKDVTTGKDIGTGNAAAVCLCAGLLY